MAILPVAGSCLVMLPGCLRHEFFFAGYRCRVVVWCVVVVTGWMGDGSWLLGEQWQMYKLCWQWLCIFSPSFQLQPLDTGPKLFQITMRRITSIWGQLPRHVIHSVKKTFRIIFSTLFGLVSALFLVCLVLQTFDLTLFFMLVDSQNISLCPFLGWRPLD